MLTGFRQILKCFCSLSLVRPRISGPIILLSAPKEHLNYGIMEAGTRVESTGATGLIVIGP